MWIDTHCHLDAAEFAGEGHDVAERAAQLGVSWIVIPAIDHANFNAVAALASRQVNGAYALGIHPLCVAQAQASQLALLRTAVGAALDDPRFVAIGEIGLDFFVPESSQATLRDKQVHFFSEQLKIARDFDLPVLLHVRRAQDTVLKYVRRIRPPSGIAHAFNGSYQQAQAFIALGLKLGFGGAMTFPRALQIRRLATDLPPHAIVLETDAPDMSPAWLHPHRNSPEELPRIGATMAGLRGVPIDVLAQITADNATCALPRLARLAQLAQRL